MEKNQYPASPSLAYIYICDAKEKIDKQQQQDFMKFVISKSLPPNVMFKEKFKN